MGSVSKTREVLSISPPGTCGPITPGRARSPFWLDSPQICLTLTGPAEELGGHLPTGQDRERGVCCLGRRECRALLHLPRIYRMFQISSGSSAALRCTGGSCSGSCPFLGCTGSSGSLSVPSLHPAALGTELLPDNTLPVEC